MKKALDISKHQTAYNAAVAAARGISAVFCRVAYAETKDPKFEEYAAATLGAGMALGAYGFCTWHYQDKNNGSVDAARVLMRRQTSYWAAAARLAGVNSWIGIDLELEAGHACGLSKGDLTMLANEAAAMLTEAGLHPVVYASVSWLCERMNADAITCPLWVARYYWDPNDPDFPGANNGAIPGSGTYTKAMQEWGDKISMWQFGRIGYADTYGVQHGSNSVDRNWLYIEPVTAQPSASAAPLVDGLATLCVGPASSGDQKAIIQLAETLAVPATIWDDGSVVVGPLSKGDQQAIYTLAEKLLLPCVVCENAGNDNPGMESGSNPEQPAVSTADAVQSAAPAMNPPYRLPFNGKQRITSPYGQRILNGASDWHAGFDIVADEDKQVRAVIGGTVKSSTIVAKSTGDLTWQWGNYVKVLGTDGQYWFYCHLASRAVKVGDVVQTGDVLGVMGNTGYSFGAHTHLEVRDANNKALNIATVLGIANKAQSLVQAATASSKVVTTANLNIRTAPGTEFGKIGLLPTGETVQIIEQHTNWGYIAARGWVCLDYTKHV